MPGPLLVAVEENAEALGVIERELTDRYARSYELVCTTSAGDALARLSRAADDGEEVALVLASARLDGSTGTELLTEIHHLHPHSKRGLLIGWGQWGDPATGDAIFDAMAHGRIDYYVLRPARAPDEHFHSSVSNLLLEWSRTTTDAPHTVHVVGETWSGRAYEMRDVLQRCALPHSFCLADSEKGRGLINEAGSPDKLPLVVFPDGTILTDPTDAEIAHAVAIGVEPDGDEFDLVIVGAGPAGLSAAVYGASEGFSTVVIDQAGLGGQATSSSLIRNYMGFPRGISGGRLSERAYEQAWVFGAKFAFMQAVTGLERDGDRLAVDLSVFGRVRARAVILATGATYRRLGVPELEAMNGAGVFYGGPASEAPGLTGYDVCVVGGANSAGQAALHLARYADRVTLAIRAQSMDAEMSHYLARQVEATPNIDVRLRTVVVGGAGDGWLEQLVLRGPGGEETIPSAGLFLMIGAHPHTDWLPPEIQRDSGGFVLTGRDLTGLDRVPLPLETSLPGVIAAGDVRHGSVKRVASAVGEGSVAIQHVHTLFAGERLHRPARAS
ncbi:MAG TPA: FAD-dependent oxidoreductase [Thermoleophilaceae bacterium]|nr:FAD-dependent oxidoreductase [Thermoleophilaceae bacterium]